MSVKTQARTPLVDTPPVRVVLSFIFTLFTVALSLAVILFVVLGWITVGFNLGEIGWVLLGVALIPATVYGLSLVTRKWYMNGKNPFL